MMTYWHSIDKPMRDIRLIGYATKEGLFLSIADFNKDPSPAKIQLMVDYEILNLAKNYGHFCNEIAKLAVNHKEI